MSATHTIEAAVKEAAMLEEEIGTAAGAIWRILADSGECTLPTLRKRVAGKTPVFDWAIGWLAREGKLAITREKRSFLVHLKENGS
jgi:hypothetical protein